MKMYANVNPCPIPFADADVDGDVDQEDFGKFQSCFTIFTGGPLSGTTNAPSSGSVGGDLGGSLPGPTVVGIDAEGEPVEHDGPGGQNGRRTAHRFRRARTTSAMSRMCSGPEPQQAPTILQPTSSSAG